MGDHPAQSGALGRAEFRDIRPSGGFCPNIRRPGANCPIEGPVRLAGRREVRFVRLRQRHRKILDVSPLEFRVSGSRISAGAAPRPARPVLSRYPSAPQRSWTISAPRRAEIVQDLPHRPQTPHKFLPKRALGRHGSRRRSRFVEKADGSRHPSRLPTERLNAISHPHPPAILRLRPDRASCKIHLLRRLWAATARGPNRETRAAYRGATRVSRFWTGAFAGYDGLSSRSCILPGRSDVAIFSTGGA